MSTPTEDAGEGLRRNRQQGEYAPPQPPLPDMPPPDPGIGTNRGQPPTNPTPPPPDAPTEGSVNRGQPERAPVMPPPDARPAEPPLDVTEGRNR